MLSQTQDLVCSRGFRLGIHSSRDMLPLCTIRSEKCETVVRVSQMGFWPNLLNRMIAELPVGRQRLLLRTDSTKCKCERWNSSMNSESLNGRGRLCPGTCVLCGF